jgi:hypothetical protein
MAKMKRKSEEVDIVGVREVMTQALTNWEQLPDWIKIAYQRGNLLLANNYIIVTTETGNEVASMSDFLLQGANGNVFSLTPEQVADKYEAA